MDGMDIVTKVENTPVGTGDKPKKDVTIANCVEATTAERAAEL